MMIINAGSNIFNYMKIIDRQYGEMIPLDSYRLMYTTTTIDREYFVGTKLAWAKCSMRFNFVELHAHEIILTWKF